MTDWESVPHFGTVPLDAQLLRRPSAYALLWRDDGALAVVRAPAGVFLPGGGLELAESVDEALHREVREECGLQVALGAWRTHAVDQVDVPKEGACFAKLSTFVEATLVHGGGPPSELTHLLVWMLPAQAARELTHPGQRWAVAQWLTRPTARSTA